MQRLAWGIGLAAEKKIELLGDRLADNEACWELKHWVERRNEDWNFLAPSRD